MDKAKSYIEMPKLTPELLRVFVRRIEEYEKPEKYSRTCGNPIIIHYAFQPPGRTVCPLLKSSHALQLKPLEKQYPKGKMPFGTYSPQISAKNISETGGCRFFNQPHLE